MSNAINPAFVVSNQIEAVFWMSIGLGCLTAAMLRIGAARREPLIAAGVFAVFGFSDLVEATTGAWWRPWWLLVWKGSCVLALLILWIRYARQRKRQTNLQS